MEDNNTITNAELLIQKFLNHELTNEELKQFKLRQNEDPDFAQQVEDYLSMVVSFRASERMISEENSKSQNGNVKSLWRRSFTFITIAASITILIALSPLLLNLFNRPDYKQLAKANYITYRLEPYSRNAILKEDTTLNSSLAFYKEGNYKNAIQLLERAIKAHYINNNDSLILDVDVSQQHLDSIKLERYKFILADLHFFNDAPERALGYYSSAGIRSNPNTTDSYLQWNQWNQLMIMLYQNQIDSVRPQLKAIANNTSSDFQKKAAILLKQLD
ncbi:hypothetical protein [Ascidiimonas sp. W6]|uniref:hypothetical protein n=1 Tax=Ascidiimonas meishanensis TaxID=3128903 RepID=UPI0030EDD536